jgi:PPOX class probable F420-dependent enzyme
MKDHRRALQWVPRSGVKLTPEEALAFAADHTRGVLLTIKGDGRPQASNVLYAVFGDMLHVSVTDDRAKTANLRRDPRVAMHVSSSDFWRWAVLEGDARLSDVTTRPDHPTATWLRRVYEEIAGPHPDWDDFDRAMVEERRLVISFPVGHAYGRI